MVHKQAGRDKMQTDTMAKIILAEDDDDMRRFLVKALEKAGHHVTAFGEGASAFEEIKQTTFDLLLTDIVMPGLYGPDLAQQIVAQRPDILVLYISGFTSRLNIERGRLSANAHFLHKPFAPDALLKKVRTCLDEHRYASKPV